MAAAKVLWKSRPPEEADQEEEPVDHPVRCGPPDALRREEARGQKLAFDPGLLRLTDDSDVEKLENGEVPKGIHDIMKKKENKMDPTYRIDNSAFQFPNEDDAGEDEIHVLVAVPGLDLQIRSAIKEIHPSRKRRWDQLTEILDKHNNNKKAKIQDGESSTGVSFKEINEIMLADRYEQSTKAIGDDQIDLLYSYLLVVTKAFGEVVAGTEAIRRHFIAPVVFCVCALFDGDVQILATEEERESVEGKRVHGDGKYFDFVIINKRGSKKSFLGIVVAKQNDMEQGLAQAYVGSEVLSDVEGGLPTLYNVVTSYNEWCFSRISDERVERDEATIQFAHNIPTRESVKEIVEKIYAMLCEDD